MSNYRVSFVDSKLCTDEVYEKVAAYLSENNIQDSFGKDVKCANITMTEDGSLDYIYAYMATPYCDDSTGYNSLIEIDDVLYKKLFTRGEFKKFIQE